MNLFITILLVFLLFTFLSLIRSRKVRKISFRNLFRKKTQTTLIILGSMVGTAMITGSLGLNDSMNLFLYSQIKNELGPIDEIIYNRNLESLLPYQKSNGDGFCKDAKKNYLIDGCINSYYMIGTLSFNKIPIKNPLNDLTVKIIAFDFNELDFFDIQKSNDSKIIISHNLNKKININGNREIYLSESTDSFFDIGKQKTSITQFQTIDYIPSLNFKDTRFEENYTILMDIKEFYRIFPEKEEQANLILLSNTGDWLTGSSLTPNVVSFFQKTDLFHQGFKIDPVKSNLLNDAGNANIGYLFLFLSSFSIIAGVFLMMSTYSMMAKEREIELGMLRAIGYYESDIRKMFFFEGIFYSVLSTTSGIFVGIYLTKFILSRITEFVFSLSNKFLSAIGSNFISMNEIPKFDFYISNQNIILSFCIGIFISLIIIFFYSKKISKLGIVNAIRGIDTYSAMQHHKHISLRILLIFLSILIVIKGVESSDFVLSSFGLIISFIGLTLKKIGKSKLLFNLIITLLLVFTIFIKVDVFKSGENALIMVFLKPMILLISLPILLLKNLDVIKSLFLKWPFLKIVDPFITKIAFAYPKSEKSKTRLIVTMYSLVLFIIVIVTVIPHSQMIGIRKSGNTLFWGYEAFIPDFLNSNDNYEKDLKESGLIKDIQPIKAFNINSVKGNQRAFLIDSDFQFHNPTGKWYPTSNYDTISDAIKHLKENKNAYLVISGRENATSNSGSKDILLPGDPSLKLGTYFFDNITFFQGFVLSNENKLKTNDYSRYDLIKIAGNTHEEQTENQKAFRNYIERNGIFAITNDDVVEISELGIQGMIKILNGFLYFGMIIGIMGISITMYRAFYDRKKTIGMLKAIGFTKSQIFFSFLIETSIIVITGLLIGIVSGIISGQQINSIFSQLGAPGGKTLYIPWIDLIIVSLSFYIASIISVLIPSYNASKIKPAEALKTIE